MTNHLIIENRASLRLAPSYVSDLDDGTFTIASEAGVGALQISCARHTGGLTLDLRSLADAIAAALCITTPRHAPARLDDKPCIYTTGLTEDPDTEPTWWRVWHAAHGNIVARITYNCLLADRGIEDPAVDEMLQTWRWRLDPP